MKYVQVIDSLSSQGGLSSFAKGISVKSKVTSIRVNVMPVASFFLFFFSSVHCVDPASVVGSGAARILKIFIIQGESVS